MSFELFVALRYLKSKRKGLFTMVTTVIGVAGVTIGIAALLVFLDVGKECVSLACRVGAEEASETLGLPVVDL